METNGTLAVGAWTSDPSTTIPQHMRKKKLHHKVMSGCTTCKRRKIKCDEGKPKCLRCLNSGRECLGYHVPKPWLFEGAISTKSVADSADSEPEPEPEPESESEADRGPPMSPGTKTNPVAVENSPRLTTQVNVVFGNRPEESRSLDFWVSETGPTLANYGPEFSFWNGLIPLWAWQSPVCRHLMVATALVDEQLGLYRRATATQVTPQAIWHYHAAIKRMARASTPNKICLTLASVIAWVFETMQGHYPAAKIHIRAAGRLLKDLQDSELDASSKDMLKPIQEVIDLGTSYTNALFLPYPHDDIHAADVVDATGGKPIRSLGDARDILLDRIAQFSLSNDRTEAAALEHRLYISSWHKSIRNYCSQSGEANLHKRTVQILFNVGMASLPESQAGAFSHEGNPPATKYFLDAYERMIKEKMVSKPSDKDDRDIELTLSLGLKVAMLKMDDEANREHAARLLGMLRYQGDTEMASPGIDPSRASAPKLPDHLQRYPAFSNTIQR